MRYFLKNLIFLILIPILSLGFFIAPAKAQEADHLVISAVQITEGDGKTMRDFIEIYNPTGKDINLKGYRLVKRTKTGTSDANIKSWTDDAYIQAHGWRLWASSAEEGYNSAIGADDATKETVSINNGIAIRLGAVDTGEIIDSAAWGAAENIFVETALPANPAASEALVRKPGSGANGEDTENNASDFVIVSGYAPHNSGGYSPAVSDSTQTASGSNGTPAVSPSPGSQNLNAGESLKPLIAEAGADKEAVIGQAIVFDGSDSYDPEGKELEYSWDFGDGAKASGESASHIFKAAGNFKAVLKITSGTRTAEDFLTIKIIEPDFSDKVVLSEILPDPKGSDKDGEWIEIYNGGDKKINLKGWMLDDKTDGGAKPYVFTDDAVVESKSFLVVPRSKSKIVLANVGGEVNLLWYDRKNLSKVIYGVAKEGRSYALISGAWQWTETPSPGKDNVLKIAEPASKPKKSEIILSAKTEENSPEAPEEIIKDNKTEQYVEADNEFSDDAAAEEEILYESIVNNQEKLDKNAEINNGNNLEKSSNIEYNQREEKNNPWFLGDMALSLLSLFLVWRYQSLKKKVG